MVNISKDEVIEHIHTCEDCQNEYRHPQDQPANCQICPQCIVARRFQEGKYANTTA